MALADYFSRSAVAIAQLVQGYDAQAIGAKLEQHPVRVALGADAIASSEGRALIDLLIRLLSRLYPTLIIESSVSGEEERWRELARRINPLIDLPQPHRHQGPEIAVAVGNAEPGSGQVVYVGCDGWDAHVSTTTVQPIGDTQNVLGAGAAACLAAANVFRLVFERDHPDDQLILSTLDLCPAPTRAAPGLEKLNIGTSNVLVGAGAIGSGVAWALGRLPLTGGIHIVDAEEVDLGNLQRYVLTSRHDEGRVKAELLSEQFGSLEVWRHQETWQRFAASNGTRWDRVLVAVDSAAARRAVQASLPRWIANAWTQPGDLGVSTHPWDHGACLRCLYLPSGPLLNEDKLIALALGLSRPERELQIRTLLHSQSPPPGELLDEVAQSLSVERALLEPFASRPIRALYTEGVCGGAVLPLDRVKGAAQTEVHVPLAHQSALAGVLLAGRLLADAVGRAPDSTTVTRIDVLRRLAPELTQPAAKDPRGICICQDEVYQHAYELKYTR
jgi:hypothetical protein